MLLDRLFRLRERGTTPRVEILGGLTTFVAIAYIIVVNPAILAFAGIPTGPSTVATIAVAAGGTLLMGLYANRPIPVAPYMGENALIGIGLTAMGGILMGYGHAPRAIVALPPSLAPIAFRLDIAGVLRLAFLPVLLTLFIMSFLDTLGTLVGLGAAAGIDDLKKPMLVDAVACVFSGLVGTSTSGAYIESATGMREGARTGVAAITTAALFAISLFFVPLVEPL